LRAVVIANGEVRDYRLLKTNIKADDFIICADGAIIHCIKMDIVPHLWIGDFDSCDFNSYINKYPFLRDVRLVRLNPEKDVTDTHAACDIAIDSGYDEILILAGIGTRFDHSLSNVHLLEYLLDSGISASVSNENNTIRLFRNTITINSDKKYLSLIPLDANVKVLKTSGLKYPMQNLNFKRCISLGVSNEIVNDKATIEIEGGLVLSVESDD